MIGSIVVRQNPVVTAKPFFLDSITSGQFENYQHEIRRYGGFYSAQFRLFGPPLYLQEYVSYGLGRHVEVYPPEGGDVPIWEGFISTLKWYGPGVEPYSVSLDDMANKTWNRYIAASVNLMAGATVQEYDAETMTRTEADTQGSLATRSTVYNDTTSQGKYGIKEGVLSGGVSSAAVAAQAAKMYLDAKSNPLRALMNIRASSKRTMLDVECKGYWHTLNWRTYNQTAAAGTEAINVQAAAIISGVGQFIRTSSVATNASAVDKEHNIDRLAGNILIDLARIGDSSYNPYTIGVWEGRKLIYAQAQGNANLNIYYRMSGKGPRLAVINKYGLEINPAEIRPDRWIRNLGIFTEAGQDPANLAEDPQSGYIETVRYKAPRDFVLYGNRGNQLDVVLARSSFGGVSLL